ncbi:hypothetical protein C900_05591 [Fulvivirga imtechensis AK7]|uniref:Uncharacterized protein n=1 Tax=Fulvivirga imtechensis AK7 TaxID=1237149 RepID=L8JL00_9BACT|nr:hypothetical protein C900_05591 [Fulvivirga imtechensis AK7]
MRITWSQHENITSLVNMLLTINNMNPGTHFDVQDLKKLVSVLSFLP